MNVLKHIVPVAENIERRCFPKDTDKVAAVMFLGGASCGLVFTLVLLLLAAS